MDLFGISCIIIFLSSLGFGLFIYSHNRRLPLARSWFSFSIAISFWGLALYKVTAAGDAATALRWQYILDLVGLSIPILYSFFVFTFLKRKVLLGKAVIVASGALLALLSFTPFFKTGMTTRFGFFWVEPGSLYFLFPLFFTGLILYAFFLLFQTYRLPHENPQLQQQAKYQLFAGAIGFGAGITNFFPQLFDVFPFGNYFIILYIFFMSYAVLRDELFSIKTVATELFAGGTFVLFLFNLLSSETLGDWVLRFLFLVLVSFFSILLVRGVRKVETLARDLAIANDRLKELDLLKSEFVSLATHQIRGPLASIKGYASMLLEGDFGALHDGIKTAVDTIFQSADASVVVVQDFLDVSRIEQGRMKYDILSFDLSKLVWEVLAEQKPSVEKKGLVLQSNVTPNLTVKADMGKIKQVIGNLIDNAVKYTPAGVISVTLKQVESKARFSIKDSGVGIKPETLPYLFKKFSRAEDASKVNILGTGLGLYVALELLKAQNGPIWAESEGDGKGSTFSFEIPVEKTIPSTPPA